MINNTGKDMEYKIISIMKIIGTFKMNVDFINAKIRIVISHKRL